jgi:hypothetical protein
VIVLRITDYGATLDTSPSKEYELEVVPLIEIRIPMNGLVQLGEPAPIVQSDLCRVIRIQPAVGVAVKITTSFRWYGPAGLALIVLSVAWVIVRGCSIMVGLPIVVAVWLDIRMNQLLS